MIYYNTVLYCSGPPSEAASASFGAPPKFSLPGNPGQSAPGQAQALYRRKHKTLCLENEEQALHVHPGPEIGHLQLLGAPIFPHNPCQRSLLSLKITYHEQHTFIVPPLLSIRVPRAAVKGCHLRLYWGRVLPSSPGRGSSQRLSSFGRRPSTGWLRAAGEGEGLLARQAAPQSWECLPIPAPNPVG